MWYLIILIPDLCPFSDFFQLSGVNMKMTFIFLINLTMNITFVSLNEIAVNMNLFISFIEDICHGI